AATPNTIDLVYIDVWQREVTVLEDPSLREIALGGPDTTTRIQTAWQVRVLQNVGAHGCGDTIAAWDALTAPSAGRLTVSAIAPPASDDPCIISPVGGYRGLENRLYRVEIHTPGPIGGGAKFKWSRNNATIASSISAIPSTTQITVQQIGRDQVLKFAIGNFIEITDDFREFQSLTGHMAKITNIDEANRIIQFTPAIPAAMGFDPNDPSRHTRVRRWDQTIDVDANGLLDVNAGLNPIEDGIQVQFNLVPVGGNFKVGDYWVFAARTVDGSVEQLSQAPPRGILHHFCRLGFIHWGQTISATTFDDCRNHWPPKCECDYCTVTVGDGVDSHGQFTDIQQAINALGNRGGVVCIGRGFYTVTAGLVLNNTKHNVIIRGMGPATRIHFAPPQGAPPGVFMTITGTEQVRLENVFVISNNAESLVRIVNSNFVRIEDCYLINIPSRPAGLFERAVDFQGEFCANCEIVRCGLAAPVAVACTQGEVRQLAVRRNDILARQASVFVVQAFDLEIVENRMRGMPGSLIGTIDISRSTIDGVQITVWNAFRSTATPGDFQAVAMLVFATNRIVISRNLINAQFGILGLLLLNARIDQNDILGLIGVAMVFGVTVKFEDNLVFGIFAGILHIGVVVDADYTSNEFLGLNGIIWMTIADFIKTFSSVLNAPVSTGLATGEQLTNVMGTLDAVVRVLGFAVLIKVHRNVFVTFSRGIFKTDAVLSLDFSIIDNSFLLCTEVGIELGGGGRSGDNLIRLLGRFISVRHLIQSNALAVLGRGIISSVLFTQVDQNSVTCPSVAIELDAQSCSAHNNTLIGIGRDEPAPFEEGLLILHRGARQAVVAGNCLGHSLGFVPGHGILLLDDLFDVTIEDNEILFTSRFGIGTSTETTALRRSQISRNRIRGCAGEVPPPGAGQIKRTGGAVVINESDDVRFIDNVVTNNSPEFQAGGLPPWFAVFFEDARGLEISGNQLTNNVNFQDAGGAVGAFRIERIGGVLRFQNNVIRDNGGRALTVLPAVKPQVHRVMIQNNHFIGGLSSFDTFVLVDLVDILSFQGNQCVVLNSQMNRKLRVLLRALHANVGNNVVDLPLGGESMRIEATQALVNANSVQDGTNALVVIANPPSKTIVTSNLTTGIIAPLVIRANNIPAP
ncbi:MAG TPA: DUF6519 domain-containing protein, partial [Pyrinomonadaceae bacterium]|nr:DUF6519 domain-containing protein [Pyrinomonadaceae bacterium]